MKEHELFKAIGDIDEAYIKESERPTEKPIKLGMGIGKTLMVAAAILLMLGAAIILPNLLSSEGIKPVDTGDDTTDTTAPDEDNITDVDEPRPTDEQIKRTFAAALEARSWFTDSTLALIEGNEVDQIAVDGVEYWYIPKFNTLDEFHKYLCLAFTKERATELLNGSLYVERNGKVYARPIYMNPPFLTSAERIKEITDIDEDTIYITVEVDIVDHADQLNPSPIGKILDVKDMTVYYEKVDGKWIFTEFFSYINLEMYQGTSTTFPVTSFNMDLFNVDGIRIPLSRVYPAGTFSFDTEQTENGHLVTVFHSEEHSKHGGGEILRIYRLTPGQYEHDFQQGSLIVGGSYALATDGEYYYTMSVPTDVQGDPLGTGFGSFMEISERCQKLVREYFATVNGFKEIDANELYSAKDYTYDGNHKFFCFYPYGKGTDLFYLLVASQPAKQGEDGIWCVERWYSMSASGTPLVGNTEHKAVWTLHLSFPSERTELYSADYYEILQGLYDRGEERYLGNVQDVVEKWGIQTFGATFLAGHFEEIDYNPVLD